MYLIVDVPRPISSQRDPRFARRKPKNDRVPVFVDPRRTDDTTARRRGIEERETRWNGRANRRRQQRTGRTDVRTRNERELEWRADTVLIAALVFSCFRCGNGARAGGRSRNTASCATTITRIGAIWRPRTTPTARGRRRGSHLRSGPRSWFELVGRAIGGKRWLAFTRYRTRTKTKAGQYLNNDTCFFFFFLLVCRFYREGP